MKITIRKIAELAGVSRGTVDRVLNGRPGVKPEIKEKILRLASEFNYVPNVAAKALAYNRNPVSIGVIMPPKEISFFDEVLKGIEAASEELKDLGVRTEIRHVSNREPEQTQLAADELVKLGVSGIMLSVMDDAGIRSKINEIVEQGMPVITFNSDITACRRMCFVGQDLYKSGRVAAGLMSRVVKDHSGLLAVTGSMEFQAHRARIDGFAAQVEELGCDLSVAEVIESYDRYEDTFQKLAAALRKYADIKGIYMATGHIGACVDVLKKMGLEHRVRVICNDILPEVVENMRAGIIDFTIAQNPFMQGYKPVKILYEFLFSGRKPDSEHIFTGIEIKIPENI